jgi:predicted DNA-binding WGR domain protein
MTEIIVTRVDTRRNVARFYKLEIQPTSFGECSLVREWGRIGRAGTVRIETYSSRGLAHMAFISKWAKKRKRGYL